MRELRILLLVGFVLFIAGCMQESQPSEELVKKVEEKPAEVPVAEEVKEVEVTTLSWTGCGITKKAFMKEAAAKYEETTGIKIELTGGGATKGVRAAAGGTSDIGGTCRIALPEKFEEEKGVLLTHVAWDALVFITHKDSPIDGITTQQAKDIMVGDITNWKDVGGPDEKIIPVFRFQTVSGKVSGVGYMARVLLFNDPDKNYTETAVFKKSSGPVEEYVQETPYTFAVTGISSAKKRDVKILKLDGVEPTKENMGSGSYPLYRPLYLVTKGEPTGELKNFMDWIVSPDGQQLISEQGTVNLEEGAVLKDRFQYWHNTEIIRNY